jgi:hypothetical protein
MIIKGVDKEILIISFFCYESMLYFFILGWFNKIYYYIELNNGW